MSNIEQEPMTLEENLERIKECVKEEGVIGRAFLGDMEDTAMLNTVLISSGFLREGMSLKNFNLMGYMDNDNNFNFWLFNGVVDVGDSSKDASCSIGYIDSEKEGVTFQREFNGIERKPERNIHYIYKEELKKLSNTEREILEGLVLIFWNNI